MLQILALTPETVQSQLRAGSRGVKALTFAFGTLEPPYVKWTGGARD